MGGFEILEHTADIGLRAAGDGPEEVFEQATKALAHIIGIWAPGPGYSVEIELEGEDSGGLLVDWLSEILFLHDTRDAFIAGVRVDEATGRTVRGRIVLTARGGREAEGVQVKAITYHQLRVEPTPDGWVAEAYLDV